MRLVKLIKLCIVAVSIQACATTPPPPVPHDFRSSVQTPPQEYIIQRGDVLDVKFFYNTELNEEAVTVRPDGRISLQLAKEIQAAGATPAQLTEVLTRHYASQIQNPEIAVIVRTFAGQKVFVDGEVNKAGMVVLTDSMTLLQAISQAGGFKDTADTAQVFVIRMSDPNRYTAAKIDLTRAIKGRDLSANVNVMPNDIVLIPKSGIAKANLWVDQYIRKMIPIPFAGIEF